MFSHRRARLAVLAGTLGTVFVFGAMPPGARAVPTIGAQAAQGPLAVLLPKDLEPLFGGPLADLARRRPELGLKIVSGPGAALRLEAAAGRKPALLFASGPIELVSLDQAGRVAAGSAVRMADVPLGVFVRAASAVKNLPDLKALAGPAFARIGVADKASGAIGTETEQALRKAGIWAAVRAKLVVSAPGGAHLRRGPRYGRRRHRRAPSSRRFRPGRLDRPRRPSRSGFAPGRGFAGRTGPAAERAVAEFLRSEAMRNALLKAGGRLPAPERPSKDELFFYCGAGLREAADELVAEFRKASGIRVRPTYTGSGCLLAQITISESGDLYMPGEEFYMRQAVARGFIREHEIVTYFIPVIMVGKGNPRGIRGLADLYRPGLRLGLGEKESTAIGAFTPKLLAANRAVLRSPAQERRGHLRHGPRDGQRRQAGRRGRRHPVGRRRLLVP